MKVPEVKPKSIMVIVGVIIIVALLVGAMFTKPKPVPAPMPIAEAEPSPVMRVVVSRVCDFVTIKGTTTVFCSDNTEWSVTETTVVGKSILNLGAQPVMAAGEEGQGRDTETAIVSAIAETKGETIQARYSWYWPPLGGPNCATYVDGQCISKMASGRPWADFVGEAIACPPEWTFGTSIIFEGRMWYCMDRGGKIKFVDGIPWVDFLTPSPNHTYGEIITVELVK